MSEVVATRKETASDVSREAFIPRPKGRAPLELVEVLVRRVNWEGILMLGGAAIAWEVAAHFLPPFLFPSIGRVAIGVGKLLSRPESYQTIWATFARIIMSVMLAFSIGSLFGAAAGLNERVERSLLPIIRLKQGVPGICWVIFSVLWFRDMDFRVVFIVMVTTIPSFFFQARDGVRAVPHDLWAMVKAWRPTPWQMARKLILPGMLPSLLIGLRVNFGIGTPVAITTELLAGDSGIGYFLRNAQEQFRMDVVMAWTVVLAVFVLLIDWVLSMIERRLVNWRQVMGRRS
ncbi:MULTISPECIES: ABC transporter permease [unclassified Caballeronia]|uniref:ABC transporter permease n=1 Tax=unclassified Caballeronia TaxID=2646786 RepID=UPI003ECC5AD3